METLKSDQKRWPFFVFTLLGIGVGFLVAFLFWRMHPDSQSQSVMMSNVELKVPEKLPDIPKNIPIESRIIIPETNVGVVTRASTEDELIQKLGKDQVSRKQIDVGEGDSVQGSVIFPNSVDEVEIEWKEPFKEPDWITISSPRTHWHTAENITIGTTLDELENLNGGPFQMTTFESDCPGRTLNWQGKLSQNLQLDLKSTKGFSNEEYNEQVSHAVANTAVGGVPEFSSSNPIVKKMGLVVERIHVRL